MSTPDINDDIEMILDDYDYGYAQGYHPWIKDVFVDSDAMDPAKAIRVIHLKDVDDLESEVISHHSMTDFQNAMSLWSAQKINSNDSYPSNAHDTTAKLNLRAAMAIRNNDWDDLDLDIIQTDQIIQLMLFKEIRYS